VEPVQSLNEIFKDLFIEIDGKPVKLNFIGALKIGITEYLVIQDVPELLEEGTYEIMELVRGDKQVSIKGIEDDYTRDNLCDMWEEHLEEMWEEQQYERDE
jgi:hypothetical protein